MKKAANTKQPQDATDAPDQAQAPLKAQTEKMQRRIYLSSKGVNADSQFQLSLIFPEIIGARDDLRHLPNDYARSSLFTARNKRAPRRMLTHEKLYHYSDDVSLLYTGTELRAEDDEPVWLQLLDYSQSVPLGKPFEFSIKDMVRELGWPKNGRNYDRVRESISRLKANEVLALNSKAYGTSGAISLIHSYTAVNDSEGKPTDYRVLMDPNLILLFAGNTFTSHKWDVYRKLSPVARRLADWIKSHRNPYPLEIRRFQQMCASTDTSLPSWRQTVKRCCKEVEVGGIAASAKLCSDDKIYCIRNFKTIGE